MKLDVRSTLPTNADLVCFHAKENARIKGISLDEFDGRQLTTVLLHENGRRVLHIGLGEQSKIQTNQLRRAAGVATRQLVKAGAQTIAFELGQWNRHAQAVVEGALLGAYRYEAFLMPMDRRKKNLASLVLIVPAKAAAAAKKAATKGQILAQAANYVRELGNSPPNVMTPEGLAQEARKLARTHHLRCTVLDERALRRGKFGGMLAVGEGSANLPRLIALEYRGGPKNQKPIALVGKAITFDTGGICIKPSDKMDEMKFDKMGGCTVLGILQAAAQLKLKINLIGLVAAAENMPSGSAYRPGDIVTTYAGKTVEIINTDAEGRMVLVDAISYAKRHYQPRLIIDLATLTAAAMVALGFRRAAIFTELDGLRERLLQLGEETGDRLWPLPMGDEFDERVRSEVALVKNSAGREGSACIAASFLRHWVESTPWVHIDMCGAAWSSNPPPYLEKGATGFGVRLLVEALERTD